MSDRHHDAGHEPDTSSHPPPDPARDSEPRVFPVRADDTQAPELRRVFPAVVFPPADLAPLDRSDGGGGEDAVEIGDALVVERELEARRAIEAVVLASTEPVEPRFLAELVELPVSQVEVLCQELADEYEAAGRGFVLARVAGGYRYQTHPDLAPYVERFVIDGQHVRLSGAALETLAIVAYKQPISRGQISAIRGVNVEATLQTLMTRGYVHEVGRDPGPGLALLYGTTPTFCERLGLDSTDDLPPLGDFVPDASIVEALERGLRMPDDPTLAMQRDDAENLDDTD